MQRSRVIVLNIFDMYMKETAAVLWNNLLKYFKCSKSIGQLQKQYCIIIWWLIHQVIEAIVLRGVEWVHGLFLFPLGLGKM